MEIADRVDEERSAKSQFQLKAYVHVVADLSLLLCVLPLRLCELASSQL